jgi:hypothetical protein
MPLPPTPNTVPSNNQTFPLPRLTTRLARLGLKCSAELDIVCITTTRTHPACTPRTHANIPPHTKVLLVGGFLGPHKHTTSPPSHTYSFPMHAHTHTHTHTHTLLLLLLMRVFILLLHHPHSASLLLLMRVFNPSTDCCAPLCPTAALLYCNGGNCATCRHGKV